MVCEETRKCIYRCPFSLDGVVAVTNCDMDGYREIREGLTTRPTLSQRA